MRRLSGTLAILALATGAAFAALPTVEQKKAFRETKAWTVSIELMSRAAKAFEVNPDPDRARSARRTLAFSIRLDRPIPLDTLAALMNLTREEKTQEGRFAGWAAVPARDLPDTIGGSRDPSKDPGMMPVRYAVESIEQHRTRHSGEDPWFTTTTTTLGQGSAWLERRAQLLCDLTRVACELHLPADFEDGEDVLTVTIENSEWPLPQVESRGPSGALGLLTRGPFAVLERFEIDLPAPIVKEFKWNQRGVDPLEDWTVLKLTIAPAKEATSGKPATTGKPEAGPPPN
jgi:hypothetical protein